jgi:hypothetical protein
MLNANCFTFLKFQDSFASKKGLQQFTEMQGMPARNRNHLHHCHDVCVLFVNCSCFKIYWSGTERKSNLYRLLACQLHPESKYRKCKMTERPVFPLPGSQELPCALSYNIQHTTRIFSCARLEPIHFCQRLSQT